MTSQDQLMNPDAAAKLRAPFAPEHVGKLPRLWCKACGDATGKVCQQHHKAKCRTCNSNITEAHLHLDYVGHADVTDRLLQVDPLWSWEPLAFTPDGLPMVDQFGGLWIRLTVAGVTRLGYGSADGKKGPDAVKECIGDGLRNAAMRFGVGLDLWRKEFKTDQQTQQQADDWEAAKPADSGQAELFEALLSDIKKAKTVDELTAHANAVQAARRGSQITQMQYDKLVRAGAHRRGELDKAAAT